MKNRKQWLIKLRIFLCDEKCGYRCFKIKLSSHDFWVLSGIFLCLPNSWLSIWPVWESCHRSYVLSQKEEGDRVGQSCPCRRLSEKPHPSSTYMSLTKIIPSWERSLEMWLFSMLPLESRDQVIKEHKVTALCRQLELSATNPINQFYRWRNWVWERLTLKVIQLVRGNLSLKPALNNSQTHTFSHSAAQFSIGLGWGVPRWEVGEIR